MNQVFYNYVNILKFTIMKKLLILLLTATVAMSCCNKSNETEQITAQQPKIKNVIYNKEHTPKA